MERSSDESSGTGLKVLVAVDEGGMARFLYITLFLLEEATV